MAERELVGIGGGLVAMCKTSHAANVAAEAVHEARVVVGLVLKGRPRDAEVDEALYALERKLASRSAMLQAAEELKRMAKRAKRA